VVENPAVEPLRVTDDYVTWLEQRIDAFNAQLPPLRSFVLPGGSPGAALLHVARTLVRRAERATWAALYAHGEDMNAVPATYLNRLSDLLFVLARHATTDEHGTLHEVLWEPGRRQRG
jgi:cob(I)alamin adenosyltransferase